MDLTQRKLIKSEWESIEIPLPKEEVDILHLITEGTKNVNIRTNACISLLSYLKVENSDEMEDYLYHRYFDARMKRIQSTLTEIDKPLLDVEASSRVKIKKIDVLRLERSDVSSIPNVYETILLDTLERMFLNKKKKHR